LISSTNAISDRIQQSPVQSTSGIFDPAGVIHLVVGDEE
jgi:hypothetical protein